MPCAPIGETISDRGGSFRGGCRTPPGELKTMSRILRNYLISFVIIALFFLVVHLINRMLDGRMAGPPAQSGEPAGAATPKR